LMLLITCLDAGSIPANSTHVQLWLVD
jgi:hypothetical protein